MQDQEESKNQEIQEKQEQEDKGAMTKLQDVFNLAHDQAHPDKIDATIRANTRVTGTNMWVLMFAIAVSSIGLNVNSTAVVIGAMLISPLMGPIVGMGYGLAVGDTALIRQAVRNIIIFVVISLITATLYFLLTPLKGAQSELLARTQPTLWDVLIAFFGGSAGMGAHFLLDIYSRVSLLQWLDTYQDKIWATALDGRNPSDLYQLDLNAPCAWVFGNEGSGVSREILEKVDGSVRIPMLGQTESLNVAMAATVCLFEQMRQRIA